MTAYVDHAIDSLHARIQSQLPGELRIIETEDSLAANSIIDPVQYSKARVPNWNASPLIQVYDLRFNDETSRSGIYLTTAAVIVARKCDADLEAGEKMMRQYITALLRIIDRDPTLGNTVSQATAVVGDATYVEGDDSTTKMLRAITVDVITCTPVACS
jgi:hypothetical protein